MKDPGWRAEHAAPPGTTMNGRVCGCTNYVGANGAETGHFKLCTIMTAHWARLELTRSLRHHFECCAQAFRASATATPEDFATDFCGGLDLAMDHCFNKHDHCTANDPSYCSHAPDRRDTKTESRENPILVTCPAAEFAARAVVKEYVVFADLVFSCV